MTKLLSGVGVEESVFLCGNMNGHVGCDPAGFESEHGGNGFGKRNTEDEMLLEFAMTMELIVCNTFYTKQKKQANQKTLWLTMKPRRKRRKQ